MTFFRQRFAWLILYSVVLTAVGTAGYVLIEGWPVHDAFYMTVITLTAVGYEEVRPLTVAGRNFTMFLLGGGITGMGIWFALLTAFIVELDLAHVFRRRRTMRSIDKLEDHFILCGGGRMGQQVIEEFVAADYPYVVIERDEDRAEAIYDLDPDALVIPDDATQDEVLIEANIGRARGLVSALSADTDNLFVCLSARDLQPNLIIATRAYEEASVSKLYKAGADHVISPHVTGGRRLAAVLLRPSVVSFLDVAIRSPELALRLEEARIPESSDLAGRTLAEARIPQATGLIVIAVRKERGKGQDFVYNPSGETRLEAGDQLIVMGGPDQMEELRSYVGI